MPRDCPDESLVLRYLAGNAREHVETIERHVDRCAECREWLAQLARTSLGIAAADADSESAEPPPLGDFLPAGTIVGRYRIAGVRGRGGIGIVYEAEDPELARKVALKVLRTAIAGAGAARLLAEARTMARLSHPHVCPVFDVGVVHGRWFLAMALVEGGTLAEWLARKSRSFAAIIDIFGQAGRGLAAAHRVGVVHRDFKPANVLITTSAAGGSDRAMVCDFGLAASEHDITRPVGGTPHYMAPEQQRGAGDARVDQFSFGIALAEALRGHRVAPRVRAVIDRATDPDPQRRHTDMAALLGALERAATRRTRMWLPVAVLGCAAALALALPGAARESAELDEPAQAVEISAPVQALLDQSIERNRANDADGELAVIDRAVALAEATEDRAGLALSLAAHGSTLGKRGREAEAVEELERSFNLATRIDRSDIAADAAIIRVGLLASALDRADEALTWGRHVEVSLARMDELEIRILANFDEAMGLTHALRGELELARDRFRRAVERLRTDRPHLDQHLAGALVRLGQVELKLGALEDARDHLTECAALSENVHGEDHPEVGAAYGNLAGVAAEMGDFPTALQHLHRARNIVTAAYGKHHPNVLATEASIASLAMRSGKLDDAVLGLERALEGAPENQSDTCGLHERLAVALARLERRDEARARFVRTIACYDATLGLGSSQAATVKKDLAALGK